MVGYDQTVITGAGLVSCLGVDRYATWQGILEGRSGMRSLTALESTTRQTGGQAPDFSDQSPDSHLREVTYLQSAMREALDDAGAYPRLPYVAARCGMIVGTTLHGMRQAGQFLRTGDAEQLRGFLAGSTLQRAAGEFGLEGLSATVCSACSSGLGAIIMALSLLKNDQLDLVVAGGYDPISEYALGGFQSMRLVTSGSVRPFARDRDGMKLGEGYGVVVLERAGDARRRGARMLAVVAGYGESCDAHHLSKPHPHGDGAARAMQAALQSAGVMPGDVGLVAAHATATPDNDASEYAALVRTFGPALSSVPVTAFKSHLGHTLGGAGAVELVLTTMALGAQVIPPCAHQDAVSVDFPELRLAVGDPRDARIHHTLNTSLGFGGSNTCVVLATPGTAPAGKPQVAPNSHPHPRDREVVITGIGVVFPDAVGNDAFVALLDRSDRQCVHADTGAIEPQVLDDLLTARRARRLSEYVKLSLAATTFAYQHAGITDIARFGESCSAVLGTTHGSAAYCEKYYRQIVEEGLDAANPLLFAEGVPNAASAHLSTTFLLAGLCQTVIGTRTAGLDALALASARIRCGDWDRAVVSAADEYNPFVNSLYKQLGLYRQDDTRDPRPGKGFVTGCGAVTFILESEEAARQRGAVVRGAVQATAGAFCPVLATRKGVESAVRVLRAIAAPRMFSSRNDTWLDRVERMALKTWNHSGGQLTSAPGMYGYLAECFSPLPLAGIAAVLLSRRMPPWPESFPVVPRAISADEAPATFGVLCTDYAGFISGARITVGTSKT